MLLSKLLANKTLLVLEVVDKNDRDENAVLNLLALAK